MINKKTNTCSITICAIFIITIFTNVKAAEEDNITHKSLLIYHQYVQHDKEKPFPRLIDTANELHHKVVSTKEKDLAKLSTEELQAIRKYSLLNLIYSYRDELRLHTDSPLFKENIDSQKVRVEFYQITESTPLFHCCENILLSELYTEPEIPKEAISARTIETINETIEKLKE